MTSILPTPEPPGPIPGQPGHFAHTDWVTASLKALDAKLVALLAAGLPYWIEVSDTGLTASIAAGTTYVAQFDTVANPTVGAGRPITVWNAAGVTLPETGVWLIVPRFAASVTVVNGRVQTRHRTNGAPSGRLSIVALGGGTHAGMHTVAEPRAAGDVIGMEVLAAGQPVTFSTLSLLITGPLQSSIPT